MIDTPLIRWQVFVSTAILVLFAFMLGFSKSQDADGITYIGTIGKYPVVMFLGEGKNSLKVSGSYYYRNQGGDIHLNGSKKSGKIVLGEYSRFIMEQDVKNADLTLEQRAETLSGIWKKGSKTLPVQLRKIQSSDLKSPFDTQKMRQWAYESPYTYLKFNQPLKLIKTEMRGKSRLKWLQEPKSKFVYPYPENSKISALILEKHLENASWKLESCSNFEELDVNLGIYTTKFLSYQTIYRSACGAYPSTNFGAETFDLRKSKKLVLEDLYWFSTPPKNYGAKGWDSGDEYAKYSDKQGQILWKLIKDLGIYRNGKECEEFYPAAISTPNWYLQENGLSVMSYINHANQACTDDFLIPYGRIRKYLAPNSLLLPSKN
jgi:hypothetical protein